MNVIENKEEKNKLNRKNKFKRGLKNIIDEYGVDK